jgi:hypothetical protein
MDLVKISSIEYVRTAPVTVNGKTQQMETFAVVIDDLGTPKMALIACRPNHKEYIEKAIKRMVLLQFEGTVQVRETEAPAEETEKEVKTT